MEKIHVLHVVGMMDYGGTEALLMNLLRTVDREQFQFDFVEQVQEKCVHDAEILSLGSKIYRCPHIGLTNLGTYRKWWRDFYARHPEYRIIHGHSRGSAPIYMDEARKAGRIVVAHCHSSSYGKGLSGVIRHLWQIPLKKLGDYNFACSKDAGLSQYGKRTPFHVINNGIISKLFSLDLQARQSVRSQYGISDDALVMGNVARFETPKNHLFLIRIFDALHRLRPDSKLLLVGSGSLEEQIRSLVKELGLTDSVILAGSHSDVHRFYQAMDVFLLPSLYEGLPLVMIEAQAAGLPCFTSDKVVAPECKITDLVRFIPLEHTPEQWADAILEALSPDFRREDHTAEVRAAGFDIEDTASFLCEFYRKALKEHGKS